MDTFLTQTPQGVNLHYAVNQLPCTMPEYDCPPSPPLYWTLLTLCAARHHQAVTFCAKKKLLTHSTVHNCFHIVDYLEWFCAQWHRTHSQAIQIYQEYNTIILSKIVPYSYKKVFFFTEAAVDEGVNCNYFFANYILHSSIRTRPVRVNYSYLSSPVSWYDQRSNQLHTVPEITSSSGQGTVHNNYTSCIITLIKCAWAQYTSPSVSTPLGFDQLTMGNITVL